MKLRTNEDLYNFITDDLAWRKKELHIVLTLIESPSFSGGKHNALLRSGVTMLYAHWEGFVRASTTAYVEFVAMQGLPYRKLSINFIALSARRILRPAAQSEGIKYHLALTEFFMKDMNKRSSLAYKNAINTRSNLTSSVLREVVEMLGFDYSFYQSKEKLIDEKLVRSRNNIAHGNFLNVDQSEFRELHEQVLDMMDHLSNQIDNAVTLKHYLQP